MVNNTKILKNFAIVLVIAAVVFLIARSMSSGEVLKIEAYKGTQNVPHILKNVDTGLITTYILFIVTILAMIYTEIAKLFK